MKNRSKAWWALLTVVLLAVSFESVAQSFSTGYARSLSATLKYVESRFGIRLKCSDVDTVGLVVPFADFRVRPYSVEETLQNILWMFDFRAVKQKGNLYKVKPYEYPRRLADDGRKLTAYLTSLYSDKASWEVRRDSLRREVRERLGIDPLLERCSSADATVGKLRKHDGYTAQNFRLETVDGYSVCGTVYAPAKKGKHPLIVCPAGHFADGRYNEALQKRYATLARMGAIAISYDMWGWGESEAEVGLEAHRTDTAHVMQALNGLRILQWAIGRYKPDMERIGVNGGSGGGTHAVLLSVLDERFTAACPVVSVSSWFDGGCPCESGRPIQLSCGGTCNAELIATFAPRPLRLVSDGGDWTATTPEVEYPFLQRTYGFYGAEANVSNVHLPDERHDFGINKRTAVYDFFADVFKMDKSRVDEEKVTVEDIPTMCSGK